MCILGKVSNRIARWLSSVFWSVLQSWQPEFSCVIRLEQRMAALEDRIANMHALFHAGMIEFVQISQALQAELGHINQGVENTYWKCESLSAQLNGRKVMEALLQNRPKELTFDKRQ